MRKIITTIVVVTVLFILPGLCWYFLQTGLDWRKEKAVELKSKGSIMAFRQWSKSEQAALEKALKGKTSLISQSGDERTENEQEIFKQFEKSNTFQWRSFDSTLLGDSIRTILESSEKFDYMLIDTAMQIRQIYQGKDDEVLRNVVQDLALMIPRKKPKDIKMKNTQK